MFTEREIWTPIPGFPEYFASTRGRIGSSKNLAPLPGVLRIMKPVILKNRHVFQYKLRVNGRYVTISGQRLVALTYLQNPQGYYYARRINSELASDAPENVEWCNLNRKKQNA